MVVYIKYSKKYPYLPIAIADTKPELAKILGTTINNVASGIAKGHKTYAVIEIGEIEGTEND